MKTVRMHRIGGPLAFISLGLAGFGSFARAQERIWKQFHDQSNVQFGTTMDALGDITGDGISDVIVGASADSTNGQYAGMVSLYSGADGSPFLQIYGTSNVSFGCAVSRTGDVDGDGIPDFAVGTFDPDANLTDKGQVTVYSGASASVIWQVAGGLGNFLGCSIADVGDLNADGIDDLIVGARFGYYARAMSGKDGTKILRVNSPSSCQGDFGWNVAAGGDVDGDGVPDFMVSDPYDCASGVSAGAAYVFSGATGKALYTILGQDGPHDHMGLGMAILGDLNGDGYAEFGAGAPSDSYNWDYEGYAVIASGRDGTTLYTYRPDAKVSVDWNLGFSLAGIGDLNRDGFDDFMIGAPGAGYYGNGNVFLYSGRDGGLIYEYEDLESDPSAARFGQVEASVGDVDGDGHPDLVVSAVYENSPTVLACGSVSVWTGDDLVQSIPRTVAPNQIVTIQVGQGVAVQPYALFLVDVNGTPAFNLLSLGAFDATGRGYMSGWYGAGVGPITISVRAFALDGSNQLIDSRPETIHLQ